MFDEFVDDSRELILNVREYMLEWSTCLL